MLKEKDRIVDKRTRNLSKLRMYIASKESDFHNTLNARQQVLD